MSEEGLVKGEGTLIDSAMVKTGASLNPLVEVMLPPEVCWRELDGEKRGASPGMDRGQGRLERYSKVLRTRRKRVRGGSNVTRLFHASAPRKVPMQPRITGEMGGFLSYEVHAAHTGGMAAAVTVSPGSEPDTAGLSAPLRTHSKEHWRAGAGGSRQDVRKTLKALSFPGDQGIETAIPRWPREARRAAKGIFPTSETPGLLTVSFETFVHFGEAGKGQKRYTTGRQPPGRGRGVLRFPEGAALFARRKTVIEGTPWQLEAQHGSGEP